MYGASPKDWQQLVALGLTSDLLPVVSDPRVPISPLSKIDPSQRDKTPSRINRDGHLAGIPSWSKHQTAAAQIERWQTDHRLGICIQTRCVRAIDVDIDDPAISASVRGLVDLLVGDTPCRSRSNSGKLLLAFRMPGQFSKRKFHTETGAVEFLADGQQFIAHGTHPSGARYEWSGLDAGIPDLDAASFELVWQSLVNDFAKVGEIDDGARAATSHDDEVRGLTREDIGALLAVLDPNLSYDEWLRVGAAIHHESHGAWFDLWDDWSREGAEYPGGEELLAKWQSFGRNAGSVVTAGTLLHMAHTAARINGVALRLSIDPPAVGDASGFDDVQPEQAEQLARAAGVEAAQQALVAVAARREALFEAKERWRSAIASAPDEKTLVTSVCPQIAADPVLDSTVRGMLAEVLKTTLGKLGSKAGIADCRKLIAPPKRERKAGAPKGHWSDGWVYVTDEDSFYRLDSEEVLSMQSFNAKFNRFLPPAEDGEFRKNAAWIALEECSIPTVTRRVYLPWAQEMFELNGVACANSFRPSSMPETATEFSADGASLIERIKRHIGLICGGRQDVAEVLISWMAFQVQQPGRKVRWAPIIKGVQGDGKTLLGAVLSAALGMPNVKVVGPQVLGTSFQDWAHGACVGVLEEIRLSGHNRFEVLDTLKPYVTNNAISIHPKGAKPFDVINTQNYLAFTNHSDALPIDETDRRWFVIFTPMTSIADLQNAVGDLGVYFDSIYDNLERYAGEVRKWLMDWQMHPQFKPNGRAMNTDEKASMIAMSVSSEEDFVREAIRQGGEGIGEQVVAIRLLHAAVNSMGSDEPITEKGLSLVLKKMGWIKAESQIRWGQRVVRVWVKGIPSGDTSAIRAALSRTETSMCDMSDPFAENPAKTQNSAVVTH